MLVAMFRDFSRLLDEYTPMGGQDLAAELRTKWTRGSHRRMAYFVRGSLNVKCRCVQYECGLLPQRFVVNEHVEQHVTTPDGLPRRMPCRISSNE
jgi:hypothetical protein